MSEALRPVSLMCVFVCDVISCLMTVNVSQSSCAIYL